MSNSLGLFGRKVFSAEIPAGLNQRGQASMKNWTIYHDPRPRRKVFAAPSNTRVHKYPFAVFRGGCGIGIGGNTLRAAIKALRKDIALYLKERTQAAEKELRAIESASAVQNMYDDSSWTKAFGHAIEEEVAK